jgi:hypothetical protein
MATAKWEDAVPDFLRMDQPISSDPANPRKTDNWYGWPAKDIKPKRDQRAALLRVPFDSNASAAPRSEERDGRHSLAKRPRWSVGLSFTGSRGNDISSVACSPPAGGPKVRIPLPPALSQPRTGPTASGAHRRKPCQNAFVSGGRGKPGSGSITRSNSGVDLLHLIHA